MNMLILAGGLVALLSPLLARSRAKRARVHARKDASHRPDISES